MDDLAVSLDSDTRQHLVPIPRCGERPMTWVVCCLDPISPTMEASACMLQQLKRQWHDTLLGCPSSNKGGGPVNKENSHPLAAKCKRTEHMNVHP